MNFYIMRLYGRAYGCKEIKFCLFPTIRISRDYFKLYDINIKLIEIEFLVWRFEWRKPPEDII